MRTARAWVYEEQLRETLERKQFNVVRAMLLHWCTCVMRLNGLFQAVKRRARGFTRVSTLA